MISEQKAHSRLDQGPETDEKTPWTGPYLAPDDKGCYGWPRQCAHGDDLDCTIAEEIARDPSFADLLVEADRAFERRYPGLNRPVARKRNLTRRGWRRG